jgi:excisionase family DNA binding protein
VRLLTTPEAAEGLRIHPDTLLRLRREGRAPKSVRVGRSLLWPEEEIEDFVRERLTAENA